jgi:hypothetical protein
MNIKQHLDFAYLKTVEQEGVFKFNIIADKQISNLEYI